MTEEKSNSEQNSGSPLGAEGLGSPFRGGGISLQAEVQADISFLLLQ